jgi:ubiquinone/menaquinone biosynthesis C-methylase UbiE
LDNYWDHFYKEAGAPKFPSQFACMVATELMTKSTIIEFGCGNGRDAMFFAAVGHQVIATDASEVAIKQNSERAQNGNPTFIASDISSLTKEKLGLSGANLPLVIYSRFFQHAITADDEVLQLKLLHSLLQPGGFGYFEFRTEKDSQTVKAHGEHFRRYDSAKNFIHRAESCGLKSVYSVESCGFAKYREEDPIVARIILTRPN